MIPKIIHYCWFGKHKLPELAEKCITSWKKLCPDHEIVEWNEDNYDISSKPLYVRQAYDAGKWAFVSDYARLDILYHNGGVYFDTDVEMIRPIEDIIAKGAFMGCEPDEKAEVRDDGVSEAAVNPGLGMAADIGNELVKEILDSYENDRFILEDGSYNQRTLVSRTTDLLRKHGLKDIPGIQTVSGITVYPPEYFCPLEYYSHKIKKTVNTRTIHWFDASWWGEEEKKYFEKHMKDMRGVKIRRCIKKAFCAVLGEAAWEKIKKLTGYKEKKMD